MFRWNKMHALGLCGVFMQYMSERLLLKVFLPYYLFQLSSSDIFDIQVLLLFTHFEQPGPVARTDACPPDTQMVRSSGPAKHSFIEMGHEIISMAILSLPLIQEGHLSVTGKRMHYVLLTLRFMPAC